MNRIEDPDIKKWKILQLEILKQKTINSFKLFRKFNIEPIIIKGFSINLFYPTDIPRTSADVDLVVSESDFSKSLELSKSDTNLFIDLHRELRHLDTVRWENLFENSQLIKVDDTDIRVLRPEDHLRVICVHWLGDGGEFKDKLWDVYYLIKNRPENFDWDRCLNIVSRRRRRWIVCTIGLAHKYLGLDLSDTPIAEEAKDLPEWLVKRVEKEWKSDVRLIPLQSARRNYRTFIQQVWKRFPPNPITATIDCEGDFDARTRIFYQIRDIFKRLKFHK